jgi:hypothetical protein
MEITLNTWHCESGDCEADFYTTLGDEPSNCPFCNGMELADSKVLVAEPLKFKSVIK